MASTHALLIVDDPLQALQTLATAVRRHWNKRVIGVTVEQLERQLLQLQSMLQRFEVFARLAADQRHQKPRFRLRLDDRCC